MPIHATTRSVFLAMLLLATLARAQAEDKPALKVRLRSGYSGNGLLPSLDKGGRICTVTLTATFDGKDGGKGTLDLDPNFQGYDQYGDATGVTTLIGYQPLQVTLELVKPKDKPGEVRKLYEIKGHGGKVKLFLVMPPPGKMGHRLVTTNADGQVFEVLPLEGP